MAAPAVRAAGLRRTYGATAVLAGVDLTVAPGDVVVLLGPNGAGKTTLLRTLATLLRPTAGTLELFGVDATRRPMEAKRRLGWVGHESGCYADLTAAENLAFHASVHGLVDAGARIAELVAWAGLEAAMRRPVRVYSRGMQQRLALARALLHRPSLLLLDEPYTGLDPHGAATLDALLADCARDGTAVVLSTHDSARIAALATHAVLLARGRIAWSGRAPLDAATIADAWHAAGVGPRA
ncbi:MAG: heme ABC exporter ATP-binding protein CcmA [bacterium]|nr:heme ABC exporter ATP-binding protein CcmA [bacterium]